MVQIRKQRRGLTTTSAAAGSSSSSSNSAPHHKNHNKNHPHLSSLTTTVSRLVVGMLVVGTSFWMMMMWSTTIHSHPAPNETLLRKSSTSQTDSITTTRMDETEEERDYHHHDYNNNLQEEDEEERKYETTSNDDDPEDQDETMTPPTESPIDHALKDNRGDNVRNHGSTSTTTTRNTFTPPPSHDHQSNHHHNNMTIGYAVSITGCGSDPITEGAAVLAHSIHQAHQHSPYRAQLYAIYHPDAASCAHTIQDLGYQMLERNVFVNVSDIQGENLRSVIQGSGCCGEKELIKLEAYTLTQHPVVVHLDLDVLVLKPLDTLFDRMLRPQSAPQQQRYDYDMWASTSETPSTINAFYTYDYNTVHPNVQYKPVQGGFLVLRPDMNVYQEFRQIVLQGDYRRGSGWGGKVGPFYGGPTFQGIIPYYYAVLHPNTAVELNRCIFNSMADNPTTQRTKDESLQGLCRTGQRMDECEDCRQRPVEDIYTFHYTICYKPWTCSPHTHDSIPHRLCRRAIHEWFRTRSKMEESWGRSGMGPGMFDREQFFGYCGKAFAKGYLPIEKPYK